MIDEKKLIEELEKQIVTITTPDDPEIRTKYWNAGIKYALNSIERQPKVGEWIPTEDRPPENNTNVISCFCTGTVTELLYEGEGKFRGLYEYPKDVITAWMPLPAPYRKEE